MGHGGPGSRGAASKYFFEWLTDPVKNGAGAPPIVPASGSSATVRADAPFACKGGVCGTCRAKLLEGKVRMERNFALDKAEVAGGFVLTCQAHPLTERVVLSFDER